MTPEEAIGQINEGREVAFGGLVACREGLKILSDMSDLFEPTEAEKRREFRIGKIVFTLSRGVKPAPIPTILWKDILEAKISAGEFRLTYRGKKSYWPLDRVVHPVLLVEVIRRMIS